MTKLLPTVAEGTIGSTARSLVETEDGHVANLMHQDNEILAKALLGMAELQATPDMVRAFKKGAMYTYLLLHRQAESDQMEAECL